jgi:ATP-dependent RNA helicase DHX37/DHR1
VSPILESIAFKKVCKIHKNLPDGGILVFLTGKQEIVRMVNKLRRSLTPRKAKALIGGADRYTGASDIGASTDILEKDSGPRSMDDDEMDGDLFQGDLHQDDFDEMEYESDESVSGETKTSSNEENDGPIGVHILPLYSMLSVEEQAKVFAAVPEGHRLIVVATNMYVFGYSH